MAKATKPGRYGDGHGLYLQVTKRGMKSWLLRYERNRERWMGLGPLHTISLSDARERARQARQELLNGVDPLDARKAKRAAQAAEVARAITFEEAARQYFDAHKKKCCSAKHRAQFLSTLQAYAFPNIGKLPVAEIDLGRACYFGPLATHAWKYSRWASLIPCALVPGLGVGWAAMAAFLHTRASSAGIGEDRA